LGQSHRHARAAAISFMAALEQAFDGDPKMQAVLRVVDEQAARADAEAAKHIAQLRYGAERQ
jgi:hypothetical protein